MKKILIVFMAVIGFLLLYGCKGDTGPAGASGTIFEKNYQYGLLPDMYYSLSYDTQIMNSTANASNYGGCNSMSAGTVAGITSRALVKFNLNTFAPAGAKVDKAYLTLHIGNVVNPVTITAYALEEAWSEGTENCAGYGSGDACWNNFSPAGGQFNLSAPVSNSVAKNDSAADAYDPVRFELNAAMVQGWINNPNTNYGVIIVSSNEAAPNSYVMFHTKETFVNYSYGPKLTVFYELP